MALRTGAYRSVSIATPELELSTISKRFAEVLALDAAHFHLRPGTVHALLGENGAGKTTLMRIAYGMLAPDAGTFHLAAQPVAFRSPSDAIRNGIAMVQQHFSLIPAMTAAENFALGGRGRLSLLREAERFERYARELGLSITPTMLSSTMSAAEQQQLEIAKALGRECRVLILDEPTAVLSPLHAAGLLKWVRSFVDEGRSVVLITHKLRDALAISDDVTVLRHGRTVLEGTISNFSEADLLAAMLGQSAAASPESADITHEMPSRAVVALIKSISAHDDLRREKIIDVSLELRAGEIVGIAGLEGSGHRLLLRVLSGRRKAAVGSLRLPSQIAFIPEDRQREAIASQLDLRENVAIHNAGARRGWSQWKHWTTLTRQLLSAFDVRASSERVSAYTLSGGNQQRLVLARELTSFPSLIIAENPTRGLDAQATNDVHKRLRAARDTGASIIFYSSDLDEVIAESDRVLVAYGGHVRQVQRSRDAIGRALLGTS